MKKNVAPAVTRTYEGAVATKANQYQSLRRSVLSCLLWEDEFYESGQSIADRIEALADTVTKQQLMSLAVEARTVHHLRHVPLLLLCCLAKRGGAGVADTVYQVISRADEMAELLAIYWRKGKTPIAKQLQKGLARAFTKFDAYQLAKYNRDGMIKMRDVLFLSHAKPENDEQAKLFKQLVDGNLPTPDTWEVELSAGKDKKATFERLITEKKLGYMALLRNLRNMEQAGVDRKLVSNAIVARKGGADKVLPFRFIAAVRHAPSYAGPLNEAMLAGLSNLPQLGGTTIVLVDVSGSMDAALSGKSDLKRIDAAAALASIMPGDCRIFTFSSRLVEVPSYRGLAGIDAIIRSQPHSSTQLASAIRGLPQSGIDRLIVITDEQSQDGVSKHPCAKKYLINVGSYRNGVSYGNGFVHIDGFSENVLKFIHTMETEQ